MDKTAKFQEREALLKMVYAALMVAAMAWMLIPEHERKLFLMRVTDLVRKALDALAHRAGHASMGTELSSAGRIQQYQVPLMLSRLRDKAARQIGKLRNVT